MTVKPNRIAALSVACCATGTLALSSCTSPHSPGRTVHGVDVSITKNYTSILSLRRASSEVIVGVATGRVRKVQADQFGKSGFTARAQEIRVERVLHGSALPKRFIYVHQVVGPDGGRAIDDLVLQVKTKYVMFVTPFTFGPGTVPTGQYVIVGSQGLYRIRGSVAQLMDPGPTKLPVILPYSHLQTQVTSGR